MMGKGSGKGLCPVSFGLAVGVTSGIAMFIWSLWMMYHGVPPMMEALNFPTPTLGSSVVHALICLLKGFLFGFFVALFYDLFFCWFRGSCKKSANGGCGCGCKGSCSCGCGPTDTNVKP